MRNTEEKTLLRKTETPSLRNEKYHSKTDFWGKAIAKKKEATAIMAKKVCTFGIVTEKKKQQQ